MGGGSTKELEDTAQFSVAGAIPGIMNKTAIPLQGNVVARQS